MNILWWLISLLCAAWVIYDIVTVQKKMDNTRKLIWVICAIIPMLTIITAIVYYLMVKKK